MPLAPELVSFLNRCQSLAEVFGVGKLHGDHQLAGLVDVTPLAWIRNQSDIRYSFLADIYSADALRKLSDDVVLHIKQSVTGRVDKGFPALDYHERESFVEAVSLVELKGNDHLAGVVDEAAFAVFLDDDQLAFGLSLGGAELTSGQARQHREQANRSLWRHRYSYKHIVIITRGSVEFPVF